MQNVGRVRARKGFNPPSAKSQDNDALRADHGSAQGMPKSHAEVAPWRGRFSEGYVLPELGKSATGKRNYFCGK
jgi:hypothetical protein